MDANTSPACACGSTLHRPGTCAYCIEATAHLAAASRAASDATDCGCGDGAGCPGECESIDCTRHPEVDCERCGMALCQKHIRYHDELGRSFCLGCAQ